MIKKVYIPLILILLLGSCNRQPESNYISFGGFTQGTTYSISYESADSIVYKQAIETLLACFDSSLSTYNQLSVISKINKNQSNIADEKLQTVFRTSEQVYKKTNGAFDITVAPLVNAWGFGFKNKSEITNSLIDSILEFVGTHKICLKDSLIIKSDQRMMLDMNAIAQGYSVDLVAEFLAKKGVKNYLVEIGGEVKAHGVNHRQKPWRIGIDRPEDNNMIPGENLQAIISLRNKSLATSGNYRKFYIRDGVKYSHTINPKTGYPVTHSLLSATVVANDCMTADAYATAFMVMGLDKAFELALKLSDIEAYFVYSDEKGQYQVRSTPEMEQWIEEVK
ncbi:MAG TPA: FAD:protein FMN transferase [Bacteroidales bacterium]|nr:FAD:protein FMN transferase [Bacteroidales bacterium]